MIGVSDKFDNHWIRKKSEYWHVFTEILFRMNGDCEPQTIVFNGSKIEIQEKQFVFGRTKWSEKLNLTHGEIRQAIKKFEDVGVIEKVETTNNYTIYKLLL